MSMDILVHAEGFHLDDRLKDAVIDKVGRLEHFAHRILRARVTIRRASAHASAKQFVSRILMEIPGRDLSAEQKAGEPMESIDLLVEKMEQQLRKRKTSQLSKRTRAPVLSAAAMLPA